MSQELSAALIAVLLALAAYLRSRSTNPTINPAAAKRAEIGEVVADVKTLVDGRMTAVVTDLNALAEWIIVNRKPEDPPAPTLHSTEPGNGNGNDTTKG
jgi:uncharacterized membrane protein